MCREVSDKVRSGNLRYKWPKVRSLTSSAISSYDLVRITPNPILFRGRSGYFSRAFYPVSLS